MDTVKKSKQFEDIFFNQLCRATEKTLGKLNQRSNWKIDKYKSGKTCEWVVQATLKASSLRINFLPKANYKRVEISISENIIKVKCSDNWASLTFDFLNKKKKVIRRFFEELESVIEKDMNRR